MSCIVGRCHVVPRGVQCDTPASLASPRCAQVGSGALARLVKTRLETSACKIFLDADLPAHDVRTHFDEVRAQEFPSWYVGSSGYGRAYGLN